jgi:adenine-specific DNA glycosylase
MPDHDAAAAGQAPECQFCPLCQAMAALRSARPEAVEHLVKAGAELLLAARALLDGHAEPAGEPTPRRRRARRAGGDAARDDGLQRIDIG